METEIPYELGLALAAMSSDRRRLWSAPALRPLLEEEHGAPVTADGTASVLHRLGQLGLAKRHNGRYRLTDRGALLIEPFVALREANTDKENA